MKSVRKLFFWIHLFAGCIAGVVILAMSVTGAILAFERQIKASINSPAVLQGQSDSTQKLPLDALLANISRNGQEAPSELVFHRQPKAPIEAHYGRSKTLFLNPWTAEIIGQPSETADRFFGSVERIHRSLGLGMQSAFGRGLTGAGNLIFLFLLLSGMYLWLPTVFNSAGFRNRLAFRSGLRGRAREWNWHNVIGIWSAVPLLFIVATGVIMSYPWASNLLFTMTGSQPPVRGFRSGPPAHRTPSHGAIPAPLADSQSLNNILETVEQQVPRWKTITLSVPGPQSRTLSLSVDTSVGGQPEKASQVVVNRRSGQIQTIKRFSDNNLGTKLRAWSRFTHTGEEFGILGQTIGALACIGGVFLVWTGFSMAIRRASGAIKRFRRNRPATPEQEPEFASVSSHTSRLS